ncbi:hypothetical protein D9758_014320 [Tetrapyrgos nigripes]|uniref:Uncharacterized protein n=1 Tax=Tetrapyrgos nigripes TaxID=182062 RepID=A0A8H5FIM6_9AGAR|nr:hypothetical protein D9758_014320 [Tetrapyrgos nigripes]
MFIEIKTYLCLDDMASRELADRQIATGMRFAEYKYEAATRKLTPTAIPWDHEVVNDVAPAERWQHELLDRDGEKVFRRVVEEVKSMCSAITIQSST